MFEATVSRLLRELHAARVRLRLQGDQIAWSGLTPEQLVEVRRRREDLMELLRFHGDALLPLFHDPARPLTDRERALIEANATKLRQQFHLAGELDQTTASGATSDYLYSLLDI